jgi:hypothetical protein
MVRGLLAVAAIAQVAGTDGAGLMGLHGRSVGDGPSLGGYRERLVSEQPGAHGAQLQQQPGGGEGVAPLPPQWPQCALKLPPAPPAPSVPPQRPALTAQIKMRDGTLLNTIVFFPLLEKHPPKKPVGTVLYRTPYNASSLALAYNVSTEVEPFVVDPGMAVVLQDVRGCGPAYVPGRALSPCELPGHGQFTFPNTSYHDGYDTVEWIIKQPWSNGNVVLDGPSALVSKQASYICCTQPAACALLHAMIATLSGYAGGRLLRAHHAKSPPCG